MNKTVKNLYLLSTETFKLYPKSSIIAVLLLIAASIIDALGVVSLIPAIEQLGQANDLSKFTLRINHLLDYFALPKNLTVYFSIFTVTIFFKSIIRYASKFLLINIQTDYETLLGHTALHKFLLADGQYIGKRSTGEISNLIDAEVKRVGECVFYTYDCIAVILKFFLYFSIIFSFSTYLVFIILITSMFTLLPSLYFNKKTYRTSALRVNKNNEVVDYLIQLLDNIFSIKSYTAEKNFSREFHNKMYDFKKVTGKMLLYRSTNSIIYEPIGVLQITFIVYLSLNHFYLKFSEVLILLFTLRNTLPLIGQLITYKQVFISGLPSFSQLKDLIKESEENKENYSGKDISSFEQSIRFKEASFSYNTHKKTIVNLDLEIKRGQSIAFVGPSGSGKSTLIKLIIGIIRPTSGSLLIDGDDLNELSIQSWRKHISYVPQETILKKCSLKENIAFGEKDIDESKVKKAIEQADLKEFIQSLPNGVETIIGHEGMNLSGGQKQRISLARALYKQSSIIVLDEPTSALDSESEFYIQSRLEELKDEITFIIIAHRLSTIKFCDHIYVLKDGAILEDGAYDQLIQLNGVFKKLSQRQDMTSKDA